MKNMQAFAPVAAGAVACLFLLGACSAEPTRADQEPSGSCVARVRFGSHVYIDRHGSDDSPAVKGRKLGQARALGCGASDARGSGQGFTVFEAVGFDPNQAVIVEPGYGLMEIATAAEAK